MIYYYDGVERLRLLFDSPNKLAALVCMLIPLVACLTCRCPLRNWRWRMVFVVFSVICIALECILVLTYSRGGFVAFGASVSVLVWCGFRRSSAWLCGAFGMLMLLVPKAVERAAQISPMSDLSIWHRLLLWKGACGISVNAFPFGVERDVGPVFVAWYQALNKHQHYLTAVSDPLTIAARYGLPVLFALMLVASTILFASADFARRRQLAFPAALAASGISFLTAGLFSTFYTTTLLAGCFAVIVVISSSIVLLYGRRCILSAAFKGVAVSTALCLSIGAVGVWTGGTDPIRLDYSFLHGHDCCRVQVDASKSQGAIVYLFDKTEVSLDKEGRQSVRPVLKSGWPVILMGVEPDESGLQRARAALKEIEARYPLIPIRLIGQNFGGRSALILASESNRVDRVASIGAFASWPIRSMSPKDSMRSKAGLRVKAINGENDWRTNPLEAAEIMDTCRSLGIECQVVVADGVGNRLDEKRMSVLSDVMTWMCE